MDVAILDIVVISSEMEGAAVGHCKPGHLASLVTGISQSDKNVQKFKSYPRVLPGHAAINVIC